MHNEQASVNRRPKMCLCIDEVEGRTAKLWDCVRLFGSGTVMESERRSNGEWTEYREIPNIIVTGGIYAEVGRVDLNLFGKHVSAFENRRFSQGNLYRDLGDFVDLNLTTGITFGQKRSTRVYVELQNLLDEEYATVVGFPDYGFQVFVGLRHEL